MNRKAALLSLIIVAAAGIAGCNGRKESDDLLVRNQMLADRVAELEAQLAQADAAAWNAAPAEAQTHAQPQATTQADTQTSVYTVVEGDTLWGIAKRQLGSGARFKEILELNPELSDTQPLKIGTKIKIPAR